MFPSRHRIRNWFFRNTGKPVEVVNTSAFFVRAYQNKIDAQSHISIIVPKKVYRSAVDRNASRRQLSVVCEKRIDVLKPYFYTISLKRQMETKEMQKELDTLLQKNFLDKTLDVV